VLNGKWHAHREGANMATNDPILVNADDQQPERKGRIGRVILASIAGLPALPDPMHTSEAWRRS
jgi:hypothetical protein